MAMRVEHHDSELGRWLLARWAPPELAGLVEEIWYFEGRLTHLRERHFPTGRAEIIVHLGEVYHHVEGARSEPFPQVCASGLLIGPEVIEAPPRWSAVLGIRLHPLGAFAVLGHSLEPLTGVTVDLEDLAQGEARRLIDRCANARTPGGRVRAAAAWTADRVRRGPRRDAAVSWATSTIEKRAGALSIGELVERTGWSTTRFTETFRAQVGLTPKRFARIVRFRRALDLVIEGDGRLVDVALDAGYYDQPHFNAEFRELSGFTPSAYRTAHRFPASASLAEQVD
jgi:AraC-like DNA-binding protein